MKRVVVLLSFLALFLFIVTQPRAGADKVVMHKTDDPEVLKTISIARSRWPEFVSAFNNKQGDKFEVKVPFRDKESGQLELMWILVKQINGSTIRGSLDNDPVSVKNIKAGDPVTAKQADIEDWTYVDKANKQRGLFLAPILNKRASKTQK